MTFIASTYADESRAEVGNGAHEIWLACHARVLGGLDFVRAVAVLCVVFGHMTEGHVWLLGGLSGTGVGLFFVLSGFLITKLLLDEHERYQRIDFKGFYRRRLARLMPAFLLYLVVSVGWLKASGKPVPWEPVIASLLYLTNYYQAFTGAPTHIVSHCWSLAVEEQFYAIWPLLLVVLLRRRIDLVRVLAGIILAVWCWRWLMVAQGASPDYLYRALETRADGLATGCLLAVMVRQAQWRARLAELMEIPLLAPMLLLGLLLCVNMEGQGTGLKYGLALMLEQPLMAVLLLQAVVYSQRRHWVAPLLNQSLMQQIGRASYGMYLFHGMVCYTVQRIVMAETGSFWGGVALAVAMLVMLTSYMLALFETPMRRWISGPALRHV